MNVIDGNIVHIWIDATKEIALDVMDVDLLQIVMAESGLKDKPFHILFNLKYVANISSTYKQAITNLLFNWCPQIGRVCFYNISASMHTTAEMFSAIAPTNISVTLLKSYDDALQSMLTFKHSAASYDELNIDDQCTDEVWQKQYLQAIAKISWLNMLDEPILSPSLDHPYYHFFKALECFRIDLSEKEKEHENEMKILRESCDYRITQMTIKMNAQAETQKKVIRGIEKENAALLTKVAEQNRELTTRSITVAENNNGVQILLDHISSLDIDPVLKDGITTSCAHLIDADTTIEEQLNRELNKSDELFLSLLQKKFPQLTKREQRIGLMIKLNYNTTEIASLMGISTRGMESTRYRLHKKLGLAKHQSIKMYLMELIIPECL